MKTPSQILEKLALALAIVIASGALTSNAAEKMKPMKGAEHLMTLNKVETKAEADKNSGATSSPLKPLANGLA